MQESQTAHPFKEAVHTAFGLFFITFLANRRHLQDEILAFLTWLKGFAGKFCSPKPEHLMLAGVPVMITPPPTPRHRREICSCLHFLLVAWNNSKKTTSEESKPMWSSCFATTV